MPVRNYPFIASLHNLSTHAKLHQWYDVISDEKRMLMASQLARAFLMCEHSVKKTNVGDPVASLDCLCRAGNDWRHLTHLHAHQRRGGRTDGSPVWWMVHAKFRGLIC